MTSSGDFLSESMPITIGDCQLWFDCTAGQWMVRQNSTDPWTPVDSGGGVGLHADLPDLAASGHPGDVILISGGIQGNAVSIAADGSLRDSGVPPGGAGGTTDLGNIPAADSVEITSSSGQNTTIAGATNAVAGVATAAQITQLEATDAAGAARPPTAHAASHGPGQSDELTPAAIGAATTAQGSLADTAVQPGDALIDLSSGPAAVGQVPKSDGVGNIVWQNEAGGVPEAPNDGQHKLRRTVSGVSNWENAGGAALLEVGSGAGTVAAGNAPAVAIANHEAAANPHGQYPLTSTLGDASTKDVGTGAGDVAAGNAPAAAVAGHEASFNHERVKVTASDTSADYLQSQIQSGDGSIVFSVLNPGGNEILDMQATGAGGGETNDAQNVGLGPGQIYRDKSGVLINLRTIQSTPSISATVVGDTIELTGIEDPINDGNNYARSTSVGGTSSWELLGDSALRNVGSLAGDVSAGNAPAAAVAVHEADANPHSQYPLSSSLGDAATKNVGTGAADVAAGDAPVAAIVAHEGAFPHPSTDQLAALDANPALNAGNAVAGMADITTTHSSLVDLATSGHPGSVIDVGGLPGNAVRIAADSTLEDAGVPPGGDGLHASLTDLATSGHPGSAILIGGGVQGNAVSIAADGSLADSGVPPGGAGGTTDLGHILRAAEIEFTSSSGQNTIVAAATNAQIGFATATQITLLESALQNVIDDTDPYVGGDLKVGGSSNFVVSFTDALGTERGSSGYTDAPDEGIYLAWAPGGTYDPGDGGVLAVPGGLEAHGAAFTVKSIQHASSSGQQVYCTDEGILYSVEPPPTGWSANAMDAGSYDLGTGTGLGGWVQLTGTVVTVQSDVAVGDRLEIQAQITATNKTTNRSGVIEIGYGLDGAQPVVAGDSHSIVGGFSGSLPASTWSWSAHGGLTAGQTLSVWGRRVSGAHGSFGVDLVGATNNHEMEIYVLAGGGAASPTDISISYTGGAVVVESSTGQNGTINAAIPGGNAGILSGVDKTKLDSAWEDGSTVTDWALGVQDLGTFSTQQDVDLDNGHDFVGTLGADNTIINFTSTAGHASTAWTFTLATGGLSPVWQFNGAAIDLPKDYDISGNPQRIEFAFKRTSLGVSVTERQIP